MVIAGFSTSPLDHGVDWWNLWRRSFRLRFIISRNYEVTTSGEVGNFWNLHFQLDSFQNRFQRVPKFGERLSLSPTFQQLPSPLSTKRPIPCFRQPRARFKRNEITQGKSNFKEYSKSRQEIQ